MLPTPFLTALPSDNLPGVVTADGSIFVPPQWLLELLTTLWRTIKPLFVTPFAKYLDTVNRANIELELQQLSEEFFNQKLTDDTAMLVDAEPPLDPQIMKDVVKKEVAAATKSLKAEIASLKKQLKNNNSTKNVSWDLPGATTKKSGQKEKGKPAGGQTKDTTSKKSTMRKKNTLKKLSLRRSKRTTQNRRK